MPSSKPTFLTETYSGFLHRDVPTEDVDLTHVGPGTPTGEYLRRFWQPVAHSDELNDLPVRIRILGEDWLLSGMTPGGPGCWSSTVAIEARPWSTARSRTGASGAATTVGSSISAARSWRRRASRRPAR